MTFSFFAAMPLAIIAFMFIGIDMRGGNAGAHWLFLGIGAIYLVGFFSFNRKWATTRSVAQQLSAFDGSVTPEHGMNLLQKYSYLIFISSSLFFVAAIAALVIY